MKGKYIVLSGMLLASCVQTQDKDFYQERINRISSIEVMLKTETKVDDSKYEMEGYGFVVGKYIFSREHVTSRYSIPAWQMTRYGPQQVMVDLDRDSISSEETFLDEKVLHNVYENRKEDISIFDLSKQPELCKIYCNDLTFDDLMTEDELYQGMRVYFNASPQLENGFYKESHISKLRTEKNKGTRFEGTFYIQEEVIKGTSGKSIWHKDKIMGVVESLWDSLGGIGFLDNYIEEIRKYEKEK